jgi:uncharacterized membrane protein
MASVSWLQSTTEFVNTLVPDMRTLTPYLATTVAFIIIDLIWLGVVAKAFYRRELAGLMRDKIYVPAALAFYLLYPVGLTFFAVLPSLALGGVGRAAMHGALFGFFAYATYDLTNLATLKNWSPTLSVVDIVWGAVLSGVCAALGALVALS